MSDRVTAATFVVMFLWLALLSFYVTRRPTGPVGPIGAAGVSGPPGPMGPGGRDADPHELEELHRRITRLEGQPWLPKTNPQTYQKGPQ